MSFYLFFKWLDVVIIYMSISKNVHKLSSLKSTYLIKLNNNIVKRILMQACRSIKSNLQC